MALDHSTRRAFFTQVGRTAGMGIVTQSIESSLAENAGGAATSSKQRARQSFEVRKNCALEQLRAPSPPKGATGDEARYSNFIGSYSKGLPHNELGEVDQGAYRLLLDAIAIRFGSVRPFSVNGVNRLAVGTCGGLWRRKVKSRLYRMPVTDLRFQFITQKARALCILGR